MKYLKKFENYYLIRESPDYVILPNQQILNIDNGQPFSFERNDDSVNIGEKDFLAEFG